jgi:metallo-beta-lactamase family protein
MRLEFWGAVRNTTGSMHLVELDEKRILLDCGLFQGRRAESRERNLNFPFDPGSIYSLVLSHAHIDHCGNIPNIVKSGFEGTIYCTSATAELCGALLLDSAHVQEKDIEYLNKKLARKGEPLVEPLYTTEDAERSLQYFQAIFYRRPLHLLAHLRCTFLDAGHILGSSIVVLDVEENGRSRRLVFTGDLGRRHLPILKDPEIPQNVDYLVIESTYGNRVHEPIEEVERRLQSIVTRVYERRGKIIIPAFSVGRTQEIVYTLAQLWARKAMPRIPVYVDSPLSVDVTEIFRHHPECYDREMRDQLLAGRDPMGFELVTYIRDVEKSKELNTCEEPCIIISASGMCEAGRILHHLKNNIEDPRNLILIVGFQAENTLGRRLAERRPEVRIFGESYRLRAEVEVMDAFSAHADAKELVEFVQALNNQKPLGRVFVVHGEEEQCVAFGERVRHELGLRVEIPVRGQSFTLD